MSASSPKFCSSSESKVSLIKSYGLEEDDVMAYLLSVKVAFADGEDKLSKLVELLKDYKAQKIAADDLVKEAKILFEHHPDLLLAFNAFLPENKTVAMKSFLQPLEQESLDFIIKLKDLSPELHKSFLNVLKKYGRTDISGSKLIDMVTTLLFKYGDLLLEFKKFIPPEYNFEKGADKNSHPNKKEDLAFKGPRKKMKFTKCDFPDLVFNNEILFFEKAKAKLHNKKGFKNLLNWLEMYLQGRIVSCELESEVRTLHPHLYDDVRKLFVHKHPSYFMLSKKEKKLQQQEELKASSSTIFTNSGPCQTFEPPNRNAVLNNDCCLVKYDLSEASLGDEQKNIQEHSQAQEQDQMSVKEPDIDSFQDRYVAEKNRNATTLKEFEESNANCDNLLTGFNYTSVRKCCSERNIRLLKMQNAEVLPKIKKAIKKRQRKVKKILEKIEDERIRLRVESMMKAQGKRVKKLF